jgi:hypothetical protein
LSGNKRLWPRERDIAVGEVPLFYSIRMSM